MFCISPLAEDNAYDVAESKLKALIEERTKFYENADVVISLEGYGQDAEKGAPTAVVMYRLLQAVKQKIVSTREEREARRNFTIEREGDVPTMQKMQSPNAAVTEE
jgi:shikimate kinase